jgi:2-polyprenyl-6-methoxyphenol hydroxylase-like FAD-dependent oxidoreductase
MQPEIPGPPLGAAALIIGGGIGGLAAGVALLRAGIRVRVFEQAPALEEVGAGVSLWPNAMRALARVGLDRAVRDGHAPIRRIVIRRSTGAAILSLDEPGRHTEPSICVHRAHLQRVLASALPAGHLVLGRRLVDFRVRQEPGSGVVSARFDDGSVAAGDVLIGCDGIRSTVRSVALGAGPARHRGYEIWRGVSDFDLPHGLLGQSTEWWGPGQRFGILPGEPGRVYWYATHTVRRSPTAIEETSGRLPAERFATWPWPVPAILETAAADGAVRAAAEDRPVSRVWGRGPITLLGDAAHPMTPNMGQGACTALEDAVVLAHCLAEQGATPAALRRYERLRRPRTGRIVRESRRIGRLGQVTNPGVAAARDRIMGLVPTALLRPAQRRVYAYQVPSIPSSGF